jgi:hypothetical protein
MKALGLIVGLLLAMVGIVDAQGETFVGPLSFSVTITEEKDIIDKYRYETRKLVNSSNRLTGYMYMYNASNEMPDIRLDLTSSDDITSIVTDCLGSKGAGVSSKANNTKSVANDNVQAQYSCHMTITSDGEPIETDAVSLYMKGTMRREKGDLTDTITKKTLSGCTLSGGGGGNGDSPFLFKGTFSSVLLRQ